MSHVFTTEAVQAVVGFCILPATDCTASACRAA